ncbi:hypothetical protein [Sphingopyxis sp. PET50]|uniref:hypothetical protein n=1 Tax=Sphingopyxis sp. PET50 TaxID=2976533 RepID=UPI0021AF194D|nr:hypothetical protein [Sphingopyxis sp. PET50]
MMRWTMPAALLLLAGCGNAEDKAPAPEEKASVAPPPKAAPPAAVGADNDDKTIPAAIRGRWALDAADCAKKPGTDLTALVIDAADLRFHESHGELARVRERDAARIVADYKFSGEGMEWDQSMVLTVEDGGKALVRRDQGEGAAPGAMRYTRCS